MPFKLIGFGEGAAPTPPPPPPPPAPTGANSTIWVRIEHPMDSETPASSKGVLIWADDDSRWPEPKSMHVLFTTVCARIDAGNPLIYPDEEHYPPSCGAAFGYRRWTQGSIPKRLYAWYGSRGAYPYDYTALSVFGGFNSAATNIGASELPNPTNNRNFHRTDFVAPDAVTNKRGDWDVVYNGGDGHWYDRGTDKTRDAPGSNASIFGPGKDGAGKYPSGLASPGSTTARGSSDIRMALEIMPELGALRRFIKGKAYAGSDPNKFADEGLFQVVPGLGTLMAGGVPAQWNADKLKLLGALNPPGPRDIAYGYGQKATCSILLEYE